MKGRSTLAGPVSPVSLSWTGNATGASLVKVAEYLEFTAQRQIDWYYSKKRPKAQMSRGLRAAALLLFFCGGLAPLAGPALPGLFPGDGVHPGGAGYFFIGLAGACLAFDRFFGCSSTWLRYVKAALTLESQLERFRYEWARLAAVQTSREQAGELLRLCQETSEAMRRTVEEETNAWAAEFHSNLARLELVLGGKRVGSHRKAA